MIRLGMLSVSINFLILTGLFLGGELSGVVPLAYLILGYLHNIIFLVLIKTGMNRTFKDPGMTVASMINAVALTIGFLWAVPEVGLVFLVHLFTIHLFGVLALHNRQFISIWIVGAIVLAIVFYYVGNRIGFPHSTALGKTLLWVLFVANLGKSIYLAGFISTLRLQVSEQKRALTTALKTMADMATSDSLTGVMNRRALMDCLESQVQVFKRKEAPFCIAFIDLDHFKQINDTGGHGLGDDVLKIFANILQQTFRVTDRIARYGGDEFVIVLTDTPEDIATTVLERFRMRVTEYDWLALGLTTGVSASIGVTSFIGGETIEKTLERADSALYAAKSAGRNRVRVSAIPHMV